MLSFDVGHAAGSKMILLCKCCFLRFHLDFISTDEISGKEDGEGIAWRLQNTLGETYFSMRVSLAGLHIALSLMAVLGFAGS